MEMGGVEKAASCLGWICGECSRIQCMPPQTGEGKEAFREITSTSHPGEGGRQIEGNYTSPWCFYRGVGMDGALIKRVSIPQDNVHQITGDHKREPRNEMKASEPI